MSGVTLVFSRRRSLSSILLRFVMWSPWSHVGILEPGGMVIEAIAGKGVIRRSLPSIVESSSKYQLVTLPASSPTAVVAAAVEQLGRGYDWLGIIGLGLRRKWQQDDAWFCSELVAGAFSAAGEPLFRADFVRRVTPLHLWMLAPQQVKEG